MRANTFVACAFLGAAFMASSCTTNPVDALATTSITPPAKDVSADDLTQGKTQFRDGNYGLAEKHFRQAVELRPDNAEAWMGLAACYDELGRFDFADRAYGQLLKIAGRRPRIVNNMGYSQLLRGDKAKARKLLMEAEQGLPGDKLVAANIALLNKS
ncbi:MAG: tetratricopeptide repeat protein [Rhizobiaceae bacterium]|jgi:Flp pilus assembly protein TadD